MAVREVYPAVAVVQRAAFGCRSDAIEAVVQTLLAVACWVARAVLEERVAPDAMLDRGAVRERLQLIGAVEPVETTRVRVAFRLQEILFRNKKIHLGVFATFVTN